MTYVSSDSYEMVNSQLKRIFYFIKDQKYSDSSSTESVILNILDTFHSENLQNLLLLPPTSPLLDSCSIINALDLFEKNFDNYDSLISVTKTKWTYGITK